MQALSEDIVIVIIITLFILLIASFIVIFIFFYQKRHISYLREKQMLQNAFEQEILRSQLEIQEKTLKNISGEIHDNIGQVLSFVKLNLNTVNGQHPDVVLEKVHDSKELVAKVIKDLRALSHCLDADQVKHVGLLRAIETEMGLLQKAGIGNTLQVEGQPYRLDAQKELLLFRIVQEAMNNTIKHAKASAIRVCMHFDPLQLLIVVNDDGQGFDWPSWQQDRNHPGGLGIRNMQNRARLIGADFQINSSLQSGTTVSIKFSMNGNE